MARLKSANTQPPGGFAYYQKETRLLLKGDSLGELRDKVIAHRQFRNLEPTGAAEVTLDIERQICTRLGKRDCRAEGLTDEWVPIEAPFVDLGMIMGFSKLALDWLTGKREMVPMAEAVRRREICISCPLNSPVGGCKCSTLYKAINAAIPDDRQLQDLHICHACACSLQAKVNLPMDVVKESNAGRNLDFPAFCWQREDSGTSS